MVILVLQHSKGNVHPHFMEFLLSLGWPVNISHHAGWTGNASTSWKGLLSSSKKDVGGTGVAERQNTKNLTNTGLRHNLRDDGGKDEEHKNENHGGSLYNGERQVLYWADVTSEIAFVVPTERSSWWKESEMTRVVWNVAAPSTTAEKGGNVSSGPG